MHAPHRTFAALALSAALVLTACGGDDDSNSGGPPPTMDPSQDDSNSGGPPPTMEPSQDDSNSGGPPPTMDPSQDDSDTTGASTAALMSAGELRATLTSHLQEHVYLSGIVVETLEDTGSDNDDPGAVAALAALDDNSVAIAGLIGAVAPDQEADFLALWREHVGFFMDYARAGILGDTSAQAAARANLDGYRAASGAFFDGLTGGVLPSDAVAENFAVHVDTLLAAFDALASGDSAAFDRLQAAAAHMSVSAQALATGFSTALPDVFPGEVADAEANTLATLTYVLGEHVYLSGISFGQLIEADGDTDAEAARAAFAELDENSVAIAGVVGSLAPDQEADFLALWREHLGFFTDYALGAIADDPEAQTRALANLDGYRSASAAFFESLTAGALPADAVEENFKGHVDTLNSAVDAMAQDDNQEFAALKAAARHMPSTAAALTAGVHGG